MKIISRITNIFEISQICVFPKLTEDGKRVSFGCFLDHDPEKFDLVQHYRTSFMFMDAGFIRTFDGEIQNGEIGIMDFAGITNKHMWKAIRSVSNLKVCMKYIQEATPMIIHQNHFINCSPVLMKIISLVRPFMKQEVLDVLHFHSSYETLHEFVPKEQLPFEYGGTGGKLADIAKDTRNIVESHKEYLSDDSNWKLLQ